MSRARVGVAGSHFPTTGQGWDVARFVAELPQFVDVYVYGYHGVDGVAYSVALDLGLGAYRILPDSAFDSSNDTLYQFVDLVEELHCWLAPPGSRDPVSAKIREMIQEGVPWICH